MNQPNPTERAPFAIWLVPDPPTHAWLKARIHSLAQTVGAVPFEPHITLVSGSLVFEEGEFAVFHHLNRSMRGLGLQVEVVETGPSYFQSVYFTFRESADLLALHHRCAEAFNIAKPLFPHLSLVYGRFAETTRASLRQQVDIPSEVLQFNRLALWAPDPGKGWEDVARWRKLA